MNPKNDSTEYKPVHDERKRRVRGLWKRDNKLFYVQARVPGKKSPGKYRLFNSDGSDPQTVPQAKEAMEAFKVDKRAGRTPVPKSAVWSVKEICQSYLDEGCPRQDERRQRVGPKKEAFRVRMLIRSPLADIPAPALTAKDWDKYSIWRRTQLVKKKDGTPKGRGGDTSIDHDRITLSNAYRRAIWHSEVTGIEINRVTALNFKRYKDPAQIVHCRSHKPRTGDELHDIARHAFLSGARTEVLGWFALFTARIGHREAAMLTLRTDATFPANADWPQPGYVANGNIYLYRSSTSKGTVGHLEIDADFQAMIDAHRAWLALRHPTSPFYFPSSVYPHDKPISNPALTHWLAKVCPLLGLGHRTTHGLRSFRTTCLRSQGKSAAECAELLGQKSAGRLVMEVYGERLDYKVDWMPTKGEPAWKSLPPSASQASTTVASNVIPLRPEVAVVG